MNPAPLKLDTIVVPPGCTAPRTPKPSTSSRPLSARNSFTALPPSYEARCPNVATLLSNLQFTTDIENQVMVGILDKHKEKGTRYRAIWTDRASE